MMTSENNNDLINTVSKTFNTELNNSEKNSITNNNSTQGIFNTFTQNIFKIRWR